MGGLIRRKKSLTFEDFSPGGGGKFIVGRSVDVQNCKKGSKRKKNGSKENFSKRKKEVQEGKYEEDFGRKRLWKKKRILKEKSLRSLRKF